MKRLARIPYAIALVLWAQVGHAADEAPETASAEVVLLSTFYCEDVDGTAASLLPGRYRLARGTRAGELVVTDTEGLPRALSALPAMHDQALDAARAIIVSVGEELHLVLLLPDGARLEAVGSASGVRSRGGFRRSTPVSSEMLQAALAAEPSVMPSRAPSADSSARITRAPTGDTLSAHSRVASGPMATPQDLRLFGTVIIEFPAPILTPAPGSYQASCTNASQVQVRRQGSPWTMTTLSAQCRNRAGIMLPARLNDPRNCAGDISNDDGVLRCVRAQPAVMGRLLFPLPAGSWLQSCRDAYFQMESHEYRAQCRTISSVWRDTSINSSYPCASVSNDDGWMSCDAAPLPRGPWRAHCKEATIPQPGLGFAAICRRASDGVWQRTMVGQCGTDVDVLDGFLTCGLISGLPTGNWGQHCRPINWDANEPAITLICRNDDQTLASWRVTLAGCSTPLRLDYDGIDKFTCPN